ncbi:MAG: YaiO family outer membrane beta-barrel protein [Tsuneonella sp.]
MKPLVASIALALALAAAPALAQQQNGYEAGVAARQAGHAAEAETLLQAWLAAHPGDLDARLQLAYAELDLGHLDAAEAGFRAVLAGAPAYTDAQRGLAMVAARRGRAENGARGFVLVEGALSAVSGARDWREGALEVQFPAGSTATAGARAQYYRRFGRDDVELVGRIDVHPSDDLWLRANVGGTPNADFRPRFEIGGGLDWRLSRGDATVLTLDGEYQRFPLQDVVTINPGIVQYFDRGNAWITLRGIGTVADGGPLQLGALVRGDYVPAERWRLFAGVSNGPDTDLGVVTRTTGLFGGVEAPLGRALSVTGSVGHEWREDGADRTEFRLGLKAGF